ncbi:hypothetical protein L7F22_037606 [Adiantum nelumboides]|nr:hypothetical protein [Adiantum nelumboides]
MSFPTLNGAAGEDAQEFLDNLEIACLVTERDDDATRLRVFPLLMKAKAKVWFNTLLPANRGDWAGLRVLFLAKFGGGGETSESLWGKVCELRQGSLFEYNVYEVQFVELWERWVASLRLGKAAPDFLKKSRFVAGLCLPLREKVKGRFPVTWMDARDIARLKERKISLDAKVKVEEEERGKSLPKDKGKAKVEDVNAMPIKRARHEDAAMSETVERRKSKENGENNSKKKSQPRQNSLSKTLHLVCEIQMEVDVYVMPNKGEGPIILGRPWLMAMQARHDSGTGMLELQPHKGAKKGKAIHIDLRGGKHESLDLEKSVDEFSSSDYSTSKEESTITDESDSSQAEIMGVVLTDPTMVELEYENGVSVVQHHINLKDGAKPVVQQLRRLGVIQQDALLSEVSKLLNVGFIYPVEDSERVSPIVMTPKKNGKWRVCVDYKPLNAATKRDHFPLPFQDEIFNEVAGYERYTVCDGYSGYFQIKIAEKDQKKTTFVTPWGCFAYRVMPFGLTNAPATFQRFITHVFQPFFGKSIRVFIDDFCIYSLRVLHLEKVNEGLARLQSLGGQLNVDKCHIAESRVTLLGHVVSSRGIEADLGKVQALVSLPSPKSAKELVSFIQKSEKNEQQFNEIKELLSSLPTIAPPRCKETFYVNPSVGSDSIGAVLMQKDGETSFMQEPIYFVSRVMTPLEKYYTMIEQMVMALMFAVGRFRSYLLPKKFVILTVEDTFPLVLQHMDVSACISKWLVRLQEFEYIVQVESSTRASLAGMLTHRCYERKVKVKAPGLEPVEVQAKLSGAHSL